jgi:hypothetical protein
MSRGSQSALALMDSSLMRLIEVFGMQTGVPSIPLRARWREFDGYLEVGT